MPPVSFSYAPYHPVHGSVSLAQGSLQMPIAFESTAPLLCGGPPMFAFPLGTQSPTASLLNAPSMYFGMPLQQTTSMTNTTSHKIHELTENANKMAPNASNVGTGDVKKQQHLNNNDSKVRREESSKSTSDNSRSPPVQRHLHTHHHTHTYPIIQPTVDYAGKSLLSVKASYIHAMLTFLYSISRV